MKANNKVILPLLFAMIMLIGLAGIGNAASCTFACDDGATIAGSTSCNVTITANMGEGNWTRPALYAYSTSTTNSSTTLLLVNSTDANVWSNGSNGSPDPFLNVTLNTIDVLVDAPDYVFDMSVFNTSNSAELDCTDLTARTIDNTNPEVTQMTDLGSSANAGANAVYFLIRNATSYEVRVGADVYKSRTTITGSWINSNQTATLAAIPATGIWQVIASDGTDSVTYSSATFTASGYSESEIALRQNTGVGNEVIPMPTQQKKSDWVLWGIVAAAFGIGLYLLKKKK